MDELEDQYRYARTGYVNLSRKSDFTLSAVLALLPGEGKLPLRWHYKGDAAFVAKHGALGNVLWAAASSSHLLLIGGQKVLRIWTDTAMHCKVDLSPQLAGVLTGVPTFVVKDIPAGNARKCKPFVHRTRIWQQHQAATLVETVKRTYGLDNARLPLRVWK